MFVRCRFPILLLCWLLCMPAFAQYTGPLALDRSFGGGYGLATLPFVDPTFPQATPIGFVRLPSSGGYVYFSKQRVSGQNRVVASRFTDDGQPVTAWGNGGNLVYSMPAPDDDPTYGATQARVAVGIEGGSEVLYVIGRFSSGGVAYLSVASIGANGAFLNFSSNDLKTLLPINGFGSLVAATTATRLYGGSPGLMVAAQGSGAEIDKTALVQIIGGTIRTDYSGTLSRPNLRVRQLVPNALGWMDVFGAEVNTAMYVQFSSNNGRDVIHEYVFDLGCSPSTLDGGNFGSSPLLVAGRRNCGDGFASVVAAVQIPTPTSTPTIAWLVPTATNSSLDGCNDLLAQCLAIPPLKVAQDQVVAVTADGYLAHVRTSPDGNSAWLAGRDRLLGQQAGGSILTIVPANRFGYDAVYPSLVGASSFQSGLNTILGFGRVALDRLFADGLDR